MQFPIDSSVNCAGQSCGRTIALVMNPTSKVVTHLVVKENHLLHHNQRLVPVGQIVRTAVDTIELQCTKPKLAVMPLFHMRHYLHVIMPQTKSAGSGSFGFPYVVPNPKAKWTFVVEENIPLNEISIHRHAKVLATDGQLGKIDNFLVDRDNFNITHLILCEGHIWRHKDIQIPVADIWQFSEQTVHLKLNKKEVARLPIVCAHAPRYLGITSNC